MSNAMTAAVTFGLFLATTAAADTSGGTAARPARVTRFQVTEADRQAHLTYQSQLAQELAVTSTSAPAGAVAAGSGAAEPTGCLLYKVGAESTPSQDCLRCHDGSVAKAHLRTTHPVDVDYAMAQYKDRDGLRPEAEVVKRGGFLPDGKVRCTTCHDARSPWAFKINLPPGAVARPSVDPSRPATFSGAAHAGQLQLPPGSEVTPKPLCLLCHAFD